MKVVHLAHYYWPHVGGIEKHLSMLAAELAKKKFTTTVITKQYSPTVPLKEEKDSAQITRFAVQEHSKVATKLSTWFGILKHRELLLSADHIHVHDVFWWLLPLLPLLLILRKKITITFHGYEGATVPKWNQRFWHRCAAFFTQGNVCIGGFHTSYYGVTPTAVSFGAVKPIKPKHKARHSTGRKKSAIFIGRLEEDNGFLSYLGAIKVLMDAGEIWYLDVYGDGSQKEVAEQFIMQHGLEKQVSFHGFASNAPTFLANYSVAFVSRYLAILEALSAEVPVIAQYNNQIKKDYLLLDSPFADWISVAQSAEEIALLMRHIQTPPADAKKWVDTQTWDKMAETYLELWNRD